METIQETVTIQLTYFKSSGKWYTDEPYSLTCEVIVQRDSNNHIINKFPYTYGIVDHIEQLYREGHLPGLTSGGWDGYILICGENLTQHLISTIQIPATKRTYQPIKVK